MFLAYHGFDLNINWYLIPSCKCDSRSLWDNTIHLSNGHTVLSYAVSNDRSDMVELLLAFGNYKLQ